MMNWLKKEFPDSMPFPQYPNFCGIASCAGVSSSILNQRITQEELHEKYSVGTYSKRKLPKDFDFKKDSFAPYPPKGMGMSNWDIIRLFNAILLDHDHRPTSLLLTGQDFVREQSMERFVRIANDWLAQKNNHIVIHKTNHYMILAGYYLSPAKELTFLCANPSAKRGPVSSMSLKELHQLALTDTKYNRYGFIFLSDQEIPQDLFSAVTEDMLPKESLTAERFDRR